MYFHIINPNSAGGADSAHTFFQWLFLLEIKVPEGSNLLTFPIHLWTTPLYPFESTKLLKKGVLDHFCQQRVKIFDLEICFLAFVDARVFVITIMQKFGEKSV